MGERLVFDVFRGRYKEDLTQLCSIHFHWSAYTESVYYEAKVLIDGLKKYGYNKHMSDHETIQILINTLQENVMCLPQQIIPPREGIDEPPTIIPMRKCRGGILKDDIEFAKAEGFEFTEEDVSRSNGLIALSEDAIESLHEWAEDVEEFYIDEEAYTNSMFTTLTLKDIQEEYPGTDINSIPDYYVPDGCDPTLPTFDNTDKLISWIQDTKKEYNDWIIGKYENKGVICFECIYTG